MVGLVGFATPVGAAPRADQAPTKLVAQAKKVGITIAGRSYRLHEESATGDEGRFTVEFPTAWSELADSVFRQPDTNEPYGVGLRSTTDAEKFHDTFDVPGMRVTVTTDVASPFDPDSLLDANATQVLSKADLKAVDRALRTAFLEKPSV